MNSELAIEEMHRNRLQHDKNAVLTAIKQTGGALQWASPRLKNHKDVARNQRRGQLGGASSAQASRCSCSCICILSS